MGLCNSKSKYIPPPPPDVATIDLETGDVVVKKQKVNRYGQYVAMDVNGENDGDAESKANDNEEGGKKEPEISLEKGQIWFKDLIPNNMRLSPMKKGVYTITDPLKLNEWRSKQFECMKIGTKVVAVDDSNELFGGIITHKHYTRGQVTTFGKYPDHVDFTLAVVSSDGSGFYIASRTVSVTEQSKPIHVDDLNIRPLEHVDSEVISLLRRRGEKYRDCALGHSFMEYDGEVFGVEERMPTLASKNSYHYNQNHYGNQAEPDFENLNRMYTAGRTMVDITEFNKSFPSCNVFKNINQNQGQYLGGSHCLKKNTIKTARMRLQPQKTAANIADGLLFLCGSWLPAYSFDIKQWALFNVDKLRPVRWESKSWDMLVMAPEKKSMIAAMVKQVPVMSHERSSVVSQDAPELESKSSDDSRTESGKTVVKATFEFNDIISGKGGGCIFLLHGKPGVGKTLTAEAVSELLHMPLYSVSMAEISTDYKMLEKSLKRILYLASKWNTIVLLDEADIFLEKRSADNVQRCALVGIFLRLLEYYQGILFLTTNRVQELDEAFHSRINMCISYPDLDEQTRAAVWRNMLIAANASDLLKDNDISKFSKMKFNGRQIRNAVQLSLALQKDRDEPELTVEHLTHVIDGLVKAANELAAVLK